MEQTKSLFRSRTVQAVLALMAGAVAHFLASFGLIDWSDLQHASNVYPDLDAGILMLKAGRWMDALVLVGGSLAIYFRKTATKLIA